MHHTMTIRDRRVRGISPRYTGAHTTLHSSSLGAFDRHAPTIWLPLHRRRYELRTPKKIRFGILRAGGVLGSSERLLNPSVLDGLRLSTLRVQGSENLKEVYIEIK